MTASPCRSLFAALGLASCFGASTALAAPVVINFDTEDLSGGNISIPEITTTGTTTTPVVVGNFAPPFFNFVFLQTFGGPTSVTYTPEAGEAIVATPDQIVSLDFDFVTAFSSVNDANFPAEVSVTYALLVDGVQAATDTVTVDLNQTPDGTLVEADTISFSGLNGNVSFVFSFANDANVSGTQVQFDNFEINSEVIPEPASAMLLATGLGLIGLRRRK